MRNLEKVLKKSSMDSLVTEDITQMALILSMVGVPTSKNTIRVFPSDIDSARHLAGVFIIMANSNLLNQQDMDAVIKRIDDGKLGIFGLSNFSIEYDESEDYISYPQLKKRSKEECTQYTLNLA